MLKIGITGGIGSGKTTVAKIFELLGVPVYYADDATKKLYHTNIQLKKELIENFGSSVYDDNELNRKELASIVFADADKLSLLNSIVHPLTIKDAEEWMEKQKAPYIIKEAALLFESGSVAALDYVIGVQSPVAMRIQRVMERDGVNREHVMERMNKQMDESIKMKLCDFIIVNDEQETVIPQVLKLHEHLINLASTKQLNSQP